ncbi:hypothetical protein A3C09_00670 [Candidatus Uhrbacteria bacterium RIFCSPHIGHO2_02_FULL_47_44]|nr:MAG: hypothetical protein A3C09_00670 [Candidatus Uhrbacteria bacterium RIFCSPHIGHO2_02_FULL_47_44]
MSENMVLVVQAPNRGGKRGHQFLVAHIHPADFDLRLWNGGKSDRLILNLAMLENAAIGRFRSGVDVGQMVKQLTDRYEITHGVTQVELTFALPTQKEVSSAARRMNLEFCTQYVADLEQAIVSNKRHVAAIRNRLSAYRLTLMKPNIMPGIRLHYENVLIADCLRDIRDADLTLRSVRNKLKRARITLASLDSP